MASFNVHSAQTEERGALERPTTPVRAETEALPDRLARLHATLEAGALDAVIPLLKSAHERGERILAPAGGNGGADALAASVYAADVIVALAAEGRLEPEDTRMVASVLAEVRDEPFATAALDLFLRSSTSGALLELPPVVAAEIQLRLLLHLDIALEASVWRRVGGSRLECVISLGADAGSRQLRATAKAAMTGRTGLTLAGRSNLRSAQVRRFGAPVGAVVIRVFGDPGRDVSAYLDAAAAALAPVLERELLLERDTAKEHVLVAAGDQRLTRLGFDLHDGPIQDVLALANETHQLREQIYPFILESHRELAYGRFSDMLARLGELDHGLRNIAHSLETKSIVSRPLSEIIHREVDAFALRSDIAAIRRRAG